MRLYLLEVTVLEGPQIESGEESDHNEHRESEFDLCQQSLPEYACITEVLEPHPVGNETDGHDQERQYQRNDHNGQ